MNFKNLFDDIVLDFLLFWNFASIENIRRKCNLTVNCQNSHPIKKIVSDVILLKVTLCVLWFSMLVLLALISCQFDCNSFNHLPVFMWD